jgi:hypothetical protein
MDERAVDAAIARAAASGTPVLDMSDQGELAGGHGGALVADVGASYGQFQRLGHGLLHPRHPVDSVSTHAVMVRLLP